MGRCAVVQMAAYPKNADDADVQEKLMAGVFPFFRQTLFKTCPIALRQDLGAHFPELLNPEMRDLMGLTNPANEAALINEGETGGVEGIEETLEGSEPLFPPCVVPIETLPQHHRRKSNRCRSMCSVLVWFDWTLVCRCLGCTVTQRAGRDKNGDDDDDDDDDMSISSLSSSTHLSQALSVDERSLAPNEVHHLTYLPAHVRLLTLTCNPL
jgi:hypothetical protein